MLPDTTVESESNSKVRVTSCASVMGDRLTFQSGRAVLPAVSLTCAVLAWVQRYTASRAERKQLDERIIVIASHCGRW